MTKAVFVIWISSLGYFLVIGHLSSSHHVPMTRSAARRALTTSSGESID